MLMQSGAFARCVRWTMASSQPACASKRKCPKRHRHHDGNATSRGSHAANRLLIYISYKHLHHYLPNGFTRRVFCMKICIYTICCGFQPPPPSLSLLPYPHLVCVYIYLSLAFTICIAMFLTGSPTTHRIQIGKNMHHAWAICKQLN